MNYHLYFLLPVTLVVRCVDIGLLGTDCTMSWTSCRAVSEFEWTFYKIRSLMPKREMLGKLKPLVVVIAKLSENLLERFYEIIEHSSNVRGVRNVEHCG